MFRENKKLHEISIQMKNQHIIKNNKDMKTSSNWIRNKGQ